MRRFKKNKCNLTNLWAQWVCSECTDHSREAQNIHTWSLCNKTTIVSYAFMTQTTYLALKILPILQTFSFLCSYCCLCIISKKSMFDANRFQQTECKPDQTTNENTKEDVKMIISMRDTVVTGQGESRTSPPSPLLFKPVWQTVLHLCAWKQQIQSCVSHDLEFWSCDNALIVSQLTSSETVKSYTRSCFKTFCPVLLVDCFAFRRFILITTIT